MDMLLEKPGFDAAAIDTIFYQARIASLRTAPAHALRGAGPGLRLGRAS